MNGRLRVVGALALVLALGAVGCGDNGGSLTGFVPGGQPNGAILLADVQPASPADSSQVVVYGVVWDRSPADGFRLYANPVDQGFRPATDFVSDPTKTYSTDINEYRMRSLVFDSGGDNTYLARGARHGFEGAAAPLTELAGVPGAVPGLLLARRLDCALLAPADSAETDSIPTLSWTAVPGATRYLVRITGRNGVNYLVLVPGTTHQVEVDPATVIEDLPMRSGLLYRWQVEAIDGVNRLIAKTRVSRAILVQ